MSNNNNNGSDKMIFLLSLAFTIGLLVFAPEWFWVGLPFLCTYFVKTMNWL